MKIVSSYINGKRLIFSLILLSFLANFTSYSQLDGAKLFKQNCASCHHPINNMTGPGLKGAKAKWEANGDDIYAWIKNSQATIDAGVKSALAIKDYDATVMPGQAVTAEEADAILAYVDAYTPPPVSVGDVASAGASSEDTNSNSWMWWLIIGVILIIVVFSLAGVVRQLNFANKSAMGESFDESESYLASFRRWAWNNKKLVSVIGFLLFIGGFVDVYGRLMTVGVFENYKPSQPIEFSHKIHAGDNEIDCQYCHNSVYKSKHSGIPTVNVCMNCHKGIQEGKVNGKVEIAKIHEAAGYDAEKREYTGETKPIIWNKVHNLPDHVYFNHSQHVVVGNLDCVNCHGDMRKKTVGQIANTESLNKDIKEIDEKLLNGRKKIKFDYTKDVLTMGWCIECHGNQEIDVEGKYYDDIHARLKSSPELYNKIYKDGKVTVKEFGGWECAKCHY